MKTSSITCHPENPRINKWCIGSFSFVFVVKERSAARWLGNHALFCFSWVRVLPKPYSYHSIRYHIPSDPFKSIRQTIPGIMKERKGIDWKSFSAIDPSHFDPSRVDESLLIDVLLMITECSLEDDFVSCQSNYRLISPQ